MLAHSSPEYGCAPARARPRKHLTQLRLLIAPGMIEPGETVAFLRVSRRKPFILGAQHQGQRSASAAASSHTTRCLENRAPHADSRVRPSSFERTGEIDDADDRPHAPGRRRRPWRAGPSNSGAWRSVVTRSYRRRRPRRLRDDGADIMRVGDLIQHQNTGRSSIRPIEIWRGQGLRLEQNALMHRLAPRFAAQTPASTICGTRPAARRNPRRAAPRRPPVAKRAERPGAFWRAEPRSTA